MVLEEEVEVVVFQEEEAALELVQEVAEEELDLDPAATAAVARVAAEEALDQR